MRKRTKRVWPEESQGPKRLGYDQWYTLDAGFTGDQDFELTEALPMFRAGVIRTEEAARALLKSELLQVDLGRIQLRRRQRVDRGYSELNWSIASQRGYKWLKFDIDAFRSEFPNLDEDVFAGLREIDYYRRTVNLGLKHAWRLYLGIAELLDIPEEERMALNKPDSYFIQRKSSVLENLLD